MLEVVYLFVQVGRLKQGVSGFAADARRIRSIDPRGIQSNRGRGGQVAGRASDVSAREVEVMA